MWKSLTVAYHLAKFNVTLQDHVIKGSCEFMKGSSSLYVTTLSGLLAIGIEVVADFSLSRDLTRPYD